MATRRSPRTTSRARRNSLVRGVVEKRKKTRLGSVAETDNRAKRKEVGTIEGRIATHQAERRDGGVRQCWNGLLQRDRCEKGGMDSGVNQGGRGTIRISPDAIRIMRTNATLRLDISRCFSLLLG